MDLTRIACNSTSMLDFHQLKPKQLGVIESFLSGQDVLRSTHDTSCAFFVKYSWIIASDPDTLVEKSDLQKSTRCVAVFLRSLWSLSFPVKSSPQPKQNIVLVAILYCNTASSLH